MYMVFVKEYFNECQLDNRWKSCVVTHTVKFFPDFPASRLGTGKWLSFFDSAFRLQPALSLQNVYNDEIHICNYSPPNLSS
jgi:hypothetical protein